MRKFQKIFVKNKTICHEILFIMKEIFLTKRRWYSKLQTKSKVRVGYSLVAKIYKARDNPKTDFLNAKFGNNPSFLWRSLLATQHLLQQGTRWRVGDGHKINIRTEPWLPVIDVFSPWVQTMQVSRLEEASVNMFFFLLNERD